MSITALSSLIQADTSTINILLPAAVGALATLVTAYWSFRVQRIQVQAQVTSASKAAAEEAEKNSWERISDLMDFQKAEMASLRQRLDEAEKSRRDEAATWEKERKELQDKLEKANVDLGKMSWELAQSYRDINEMRIQMDEFIKTIARLEAENVRLKSSPSAPSRGKM